MHQTLDTDTGPRWELRARVASGVLFGAAVVGLFVMWDRSEPRPRLDPDGWRGGWPDLFGLVVLLSMLAGLALSVRGTWGAAVVRAILAAVGTAWLGLGIFLASAFGGRPPDWMGGWVTFWALISAFVTNVLAVFAALAGRRSRTERGGTERPVLP